MTNILSLGFLYHMGFYQVPGKCDHIHLNAVNHMAGKYKYETRSSENNIKIRSITKYLCNHTWLD